jgi:hypothetical protein
VGNREAGEVPVDFNAVETCGDAAFCSFGELFSHGVDLVYGHGSRWIGRVFGSIESFAADGDIR